MATEAQIRANRKYQSEKASRFTVQVKLEIGEKFREIAQKNGDTINGILMNAIKEYIEKNS